MELGPPTSEAMKYKVPCPHPPITASLILPAIFWGQNYVPVRRYALIFFGFSFFIQFLDLFFLLFSYFSSLLFNFSYLSLLILLFLSLLILLAGTILCLLILLFLYFKLFVVLQARYIRHSEGFFEGAKPFLIHLRSKLM